MTIGYNCDVERTGTTDGRTTMSIDLDMLACSMIEAARRSLTLMGYDGEKLDGSRLHKAIMDVMIPQVYEIEVAKATESRAGR